MPPRRSASLPVLLVPLVAALTGCGGRDPTLLADMGAVEVTVDYALWADAGPGETNVLLAPAEGCPTFIGEATLNGALLEVEDPGHTEHGSYFFVPTTSCITPHFWEGSPDIGADEALELVLADDSATWRVTSADAFVMGYAPPTGTIAPGDTVVLDWSGPSVPPDVFVDTWHADLGVYTPYEVLEDGDIQLTFPADLAPGDYQVVVDTHNVAAPVDTCEGFASCEVTADYATRIDVVLE